MSSRKGVQRPSGSVSSDASSKGKAVANITDNGVSQLSQGLSQMSMQSASAQDDGWEVPGRKSKNKVVSSAPKQLAPQPSNAKAWGNPDTAQKLGMHGTVGSGRGYGQPFPALPADPKKTSGRGHMKPHQRCTSSPDPSYLGQPPVTCPPLKKGCDWASIAASAQPSGDGMNRRETSQGVVNDSKYDDSEDDEGSDDEIYESDDDLVSDGFDSDESSKSHETRKQNRWLKTFFSDLDTFTVQQLNEPERQWHCPACQGGPGAIDWYRGLLPLIAHAKTKKSKRVKLHREFAELLEEELKSRGTSAVHAGEMYGKWKGPDEQPDKQIVWPPMVIIMNTKHDKDDNDKWLGMGNLELVQYFSDFSPSRARHSYGPQGHRGISVLIFEASAVGYTEAERLSKHFQDTGKGRLAWESNKVPFYSGGVRQLFGYMAEKRDMDNFNLHSQVKSKLKYEMRSYQEMVVNQMKQMSEDNQKLTWYKTKAANEQRSKQALQDTVGALSVKLRETAEHSRVVKLRIKQHHEQNRDEMDYQEAYFKEQMQELYDARNAKAEKFEKDQLSEREILTESFGSSAQERQLKEKEIAKFIQNQDDKMEEFNRRRQELMKKQEKRKLNMQQRHLEERMALEKEFDEEFNSLIEEYTPQV